MTLIPISIAVHLYAQNLAYIMVDGIQETVTQVYYNLMKGFMYYKILQKRNEHISTSMHTQMHR